MRFDITSGRKTDHWFVAIDKGDITVSHRSGEADAAVATDKAGFDALASGETNAIAAVLRGTVQVEGDWRLLSLFRRLLPGPPTRKRRTAPRTGRSRP